MVVTQHVLHCMPHSVLEIRLYYPWYLPGIKQNNKPAFVDDSPSRSLEYIELGIKTNLQYFCYYFWNGLPLITISGFSTA